MGQEDEKRRELNERLWWFEYARKSKTIWNRIGVPKVIIDHEPS